MTSIRKPKRVTIRGNDEREYNYLVKGGEDLRQDQRVEQLFYIMNQVLNKDPACRQRKLKLKTYQVIPLTTRLVDSKTSGFNACLTLHKPRRSIHCLLCCLGSKATQRDPFFWHLSVGPSVCHVVTLLVFMLFLASTCYVSQATHAFLGMLPIGCSHLSVTWDLWQAHMNMLVQNSFIVL